MSWGRWQMLVLTGQQQQQWEHKREKEISRGRLGRCAIFCWNFIRGKNLRHLSCYSADVKIRNSSSFPWAVHYNIKLQHLPLPKTLSANHPHSLCCSGQSCSKTREIISTSCRGKSICNKTRVLLTAGEVLKYPKCVSLASLHTSLDN